MLLSTVRKRKITYVYSNQNKSANKNPLIGTVNDKIRYDLQRKRHKLPTKDKVLYTCENKSQAKAQKCDQNAQNPQNNIANNKTSYDVERKQLELQTKEKELNEREYKLRKKTRKFNESVQKIHLIQHETERTIENANETLEPLVDTTIKANNFNNATKKVKFSKGRRNSCGPIRLVGTPRRNSDYDRKRKHGTLTTDEWYSTMNSEDTYYSWRDRYKSKRIPIRNSVTVQHILICSSVAVVCSPCLFVLLILSSCCWCPLVGFLDNRLLL